MKTLDEAKMLLHNRDYESAEKLILGIKYKNMPEEFKWVGDIFLALAYA